MTFKSSISLTDEQAEFARALVEAGRYSSLSAVLQQGLELLRQRTEEEEWETKALKRLLEERMKGPFISHEEFRTQIDMMLEKKRKGYGL